MKGYFKNNNNNNVSTPYFTSKQLGTIVDIFIGSIYVRDLKFNIPVRRRVILVASAEGLLHVFDQRYHHRDGNKKKKKKKYTLGRRIKEIRI